MFSPILSTNFSQLKKMVDSEFKIGETILNCIELKWENYCKITCTLLFKFFSPLLIRLLIGLKWILQTCLYCYFQRKSIILVHLWRIISNIVRQYIRVLLMNYIRACSSANLHGGQAFKIFRPGGTFLNLCPLFS